MAEQQRWELLKAIPDAVLLVRQDGTIAFANAQAEELFGYTRDELVALPLDLLLPERFRKRHSYQVAAYFTSPSVRRMGTRPELSALCKNGLEIPVDISISPIETPDGPMAITSVRDVSNHRELESQLRSALAEVENLKDRLSEENAYLLEEIHRDRMPKDIVGRSDLLSLMLHKVDQVATTDSNVLIVGETGTGKELIAWAIHNRSRRGDRPLINVNCASLPSSLIESELFGHEKGAFTGAIARKIGRFELADGGTLFLDEIGELHSDLQAKLLRVLQEGEFERLGASTTTRVNVRVIAATNRDLHRAIREERFRQDLYYRLAVFPVEVPPLRARRDDIPLLVWHFIAKKQGQLGKNIDEVSQETMERLVAYDWPGNVRELENVIERAMILSPSSALIVEQLDARPKPSSLDSRAVQAASASIADVDRAHILKVLEECGWRIKGEGNAAHRLGLKPSTLRYRMKKLGIRRPQSGHLKS